jgi:serine protease inhibitor
MSTPRIFAAAAVAAVLATSGSVVARATEHESFQARLQSAQAKLAGSLIQRLSGRGKGVVTVSPASLAGAAAALDLGASNGFRRALHGAMGFRKAADDAADFAALRGQVSKLAAREGTPLRMANSVAFDESIALYPGVPLAFRQAGLNHSVVDFSAPGTAENLNAWVREHTAGLVPEIVDRLPGGTSMLVLNALHFKDRWKVPFDVAETGTAPFKRVGAKPLAVSMMHLPQGRYLFRRDARFVGIELPYATDRFRMVIVTTRGERAAPARTFRAVDEWLTGRDFAEVDGELALPRLFVSSREDLTGALDAVGLRAARLAPGSLSGFTADAAQITRVLQRIELRLNEEGTEAAATTAVTVERGSTADYVRMIVDKPFVFALRDTATGLILIAGYVGQPTAVATVAR